MEEKTKKEKRMVQIGVKCWFDRTKEGYKTTREEPIYAEWTPEIQARHDRAIENFAKFIYEDIKKFEANGGDLSKIGTPEGEKQYDEYRQKQIEEQRHKRKLKEIKSKMTDEELEEFLKWKENKNK